jgi:hypothetical protein
MKEQKITSVLGTALNAEIRYTPSDINQEIQNDDFIIGEVELSLGTNLLGDSRACKVIVEGKQRAESDYEKPMDRIDGRLWAGPICRRGHREEGIATRETLPK